MYRLIMYPIFLYMFLALSALIWLVVKAYRFVKNG